MSHTSTPAKRHHLPPGWLLLTALLLGGCSTTLPWRETVPVKQYLLEWQPAGSAPQAAAQSPSLQISAVRAAAGYTGSAMLYVRRPHQLEAFARHRWADTPARMLEPLLVRAAEHSGRFSNVVAAGGRARASVRLDTQLLRLQQVFEGEASHVELSVRFTLIDTASSQVRDSRLIEITESATELSPYGGVEAAQRATARLLAELGALLATTPN